MRNLSEVDADLKRLGRPVHPGCAGRFSPQALAQWRRDLAQWQAASPDAQARYELLLEEWEAIERAMVKARASISRLTACGIPPRVARALVVPQETFPLKAAAQWLDSPKQYLVLAGHPGTGKSVAAGWALVRAAEMGAVVAWVEAVQLATIAGGFNGVAAMERFKHVDVLVLDDYGTEHPSPFVDSVFHELLSARHENENRTVFTHNLERPAFRERLGKRLADRVASSCSYVECAGASLRGGQ